MYVKPANGYEEDIHCGQKQVLVIEEIFLDFSRERGEQVSSKRKTDLWLVYNSLGGLLCGLQAQDMKQ